jgi:arabinofuranan 3-O-arabinosyltransferase
VEPGDRRAEAVTDDRNCAFAFYVRLTAACLTLLGLAMIQDPGLLVADTKFDLVLAPADFLGRAVHLWDAEGAFGQLQNQAYGYLWPMGPFFLVGWLLDVPGWVIQRLWLAVVMSVALVGSAKLARTLGVRSDLACIVAGFAFALSPRMLTTLGPISIEAWPSALCPWVLLPLVNGAVRGSAHRAAALSGLAVAMVGGVNAAAAFAVLPLGMLWLLLLEPGRRRRTMIRWWPLFTALGTLWWLVPLVIMGVYSPPFLDFIESASNTTFPTTPFDALRGTSNWVPYVSTDSRAGNDLIRESYLIINSGVVLFAGLVGLLHRRNPHRQFLALGVVIGMFMVTMGHLGAVQGWGAESLHAALDGVLAPLRNVHKFDPIIRLPLVLGLAWLVDHLAGEWRAHRESRVEQRAPQSPNAMIVLVTTVVAVFGASLPILAGRVTPAGAMAGVPDYWSQAAGWLHGQEESGAALLVPGSSFGTYVWGSPRDEPMQALASSRWAVRNAVPLAPPGNIRMLDELERRFAQGVGSPGLASYLKRAGVTHVVVRNDLERGSDIPDPVLVHQAIADSPGLERVAEFGPDIGGEAHLDGDDGRVLVNSGWQNEYPALEVFEVAGMPETGRSDDQVPSVVGGPEDLLDLADLDIIGDEPTLLATDGQQELGGSAPLLLTDGLRATERNFGRVHDGMSQTLTPDDPLRIGGASRDYLLPNQDQWSTRAHVTGVKQVTASSSMSDANAYGVVQPGEMPYAAVDDHPDTAWTSNYSTVEAAWWQVDFGASRYVRTVVVRAGDEGRQVIRLRTNGRISDAIALDAGASRAIRIDDPRATWLRIEDVSGRTGNKLSLAEVDVPGLVVTRRLRLPALESLTKAPDAIALRAVQDGRTGCVRVDQAVRCVPGREVASEEPYEFRRDLTLPYRSRYVGELHTRARVSTASEARLLRNLPVGISASSRGNPDLRASAIAAVDGDQGTTWTASMTDPRPSLSLNWIDRRVITGLRVTVSPDSPAKAPREATLIWPGGRRRIELSSRGTTTFPPIRTDRLTLRIEEAERVSSLDFDSSALPVPVGVSELTVFGLPYLPIALPTTKTTYECGAGPTLMVNGNTIATAVRASPAELYTGAVVPARLCTPGQGISLVGDANQVDVVGSDGFVPTSLVLRRALGSASASVVASSVPAGLRETSPVSRRLYPSEGTTMAALTENVNQGWFATQRGDRLEPLIVDGWQQGWRLEHGGDEVQIDFVPDRAYRLGLGGGLVGLVLLSGIVLAWRRRGYQENAVPPLVPRDMPWPVLGAIAVLTGGLLGGWAGCLLAACGFGGSWALSRWAPSIGPWLVAACILPAAGAYVVRPWGADAGWAGDLAWPGYLVVLVVGSLLAVTSRAERPRFLNRRAGSSTRR